MTIEAKSLRPEDMGTLCPQCKHLFALGDITYCRENTVRNRLFCTADCLLEWMGFQSPPSEPRKVVRHA